MTDQFVGEIRVFGFGFAPKGWAICQGQTLPISQNTALFSLLGTYYGGDGKSTFALPNLQGNVAVNQGQNPSGSNYTIGSAGGASAVTLTAAQTPPHSHGLNATNASATTTSPTGNILAQAGTPGSRTQPGNAGKMYSPNAASTAMSASSLQLVGSGGAHNNMQPYLVLNYCIALQGIYPQRP